MVRGQISTIPHLGSASQTRPQTGTMSDSVWQECHRGLRQNPRGTEHSLLPDELAVPGHQAKVHFEQAIEHTQLVAQGPFILCGIPADGDEQAFSKL